MHYDMKFDYINHSISSSANDNKCSNKHINKNSRSVKHDTSMVNRSHHHLRLVNSLNSISNVPLMIFHQNITGLCNKTEELLNSWENEIPHILCFTEHHLGMKYIVHVLNIITLGLITVGRVINMVEFAYLCMKLYCSQPLR